MQSSDVRSQVREVARGTANNKIRTSDLRELRLPLPSLADQQRIIERWSVVDRRHSGIDRALDRQIALLRERRQALITAAVTGKLAIPITAAANAAACAGRADVGVG